MTHSPLDPLVTVLDEGATAADVWANLLAADAENVRYRELYDGLVGRHGRLLTAGEQLLAGRLKMVGFAAVLREVGK